MSDLPKLMISYSRVDVEFALRLVRDLKSHGIAVWLDRIDIRAGSNWDAEIEKALNEAKVLLVVLSQNASKSEHVKNEISHALESGKQVFPLIIDSGPVPLMITRVQREDFRGEYEPALKKLVTRIRGVGRTEALASVTEEEVTALKRESAQRLADHDKRESRSSLPRLSTEAIVTSVRRPARKSGAGVALLVTGLLLSAASAATLVLAWRYPAWLPEPVSAALRPYLPQTPATDAYPDVPPLPVRKVAAPGVATSHVEPETQIQAEEATLSASALAQNSATPQPAASGLASAPQNAPLPSSALSDSTLKDTAQASSAQLHAAASNAPSPSVAAASVAAVPAEAPLATYRSTPIRWRGAWLQKCTATTDGSLRADLVVGLNTLQVIVTRYPVLQNAPCTGGFVRHTEEYEVERIAEYKAGRFTVDLRIRTLMLMPSSLAATLKAEKYAGVSNWENAKQFNMLGQRSLGYFEDRSVDSNALLYGTWQLKDRRLQYMWAKDMASDPDKRPALPEANWSFEASQSQ